MASVGDWDPSFLIYFLICCALTIFFLLYLNRVLASLVSYGIRAYTWHKFRVYIDIKALQISLLGGRIFFTGLRYHGDNETFVIQQGHITWRYWLRRVREVGLLRHENKAQDTQDVDEMGGSVSKADKAGKLPCRITVSLRGVEWFVYNRTPAYDSILAGLDIEERQSSTSSSASVATGTGTNGHSEKSTEAGRQTLRNRGARTAAAESGGMNAGSLGLEKTGTTKGSSANENAAIERLAPPLRTLSDADEFVGILAGEADLPLMLQILPIHIDCHKAALVMGNENTPGILVAKFDSVGVEVDAVSSPTPDLYRQTYEVTCCRPVVEFKDNDDYREDQATRASKEKAPPSKPGIVYRKSFVNRHRKRFLGRLHALVPFWQRSVESFAPNYRTSLATPTSHAPGHNQWQGLSRYLAESEEDDRTRWMAVEYAAVSTIIDSPAIVITMYWDVVGKVRAASDLRRDSSVDYSRDINGEEPPAWGINVSVKGGTVNYGPWADRHRAELQRVFFPSLCKDATPAKPLDPGADRVPTKMKFYVEFDEQVMVRILLREESKNWRFRGKVPPMKQRQPEGKRRQRGQKKKTSTGDATQTRPAGWLDLKVAANSTITYSMDMFAGAGGSISTLDVDLPSTEMSSSVNHDLLWRSGAFKVLCDLSTPLKWNGLRSWRFGIKSRDLELFLLRDHIYLLSDLVDDWSAGPPADYLVFCPFKYFIDLELQDLKINLNVNDANIIDKATSFEDNTYLIFKSPSLLANVCLPIDKFRPSRNAIPFEVRADYLEATLNAPQWNTQASFLTTPDLAHIENLLVDGEYHYYATTSPSNTDSLVMNVVAQSPVIHLYGFLIRYIIQLKDNYFGDSVHFKTLEEYQTMLQLKEQDPAADVASRPPLKKSNDFDVMLNLKVDDPRVLIPANLYSGQKFIQLELPTFSVDLRLTNYYMDVILSLSPVSLSYGSAESGMDTPGLSATGTQLFIDGVELYGNRLFGSPNEVTYLCNWDVSVGAVSGECTAEFLSTLLQGVSSLGLMFDDEENALIPYSSIAFHDITFLRLLVQSVKIWLHVDEAAFLFSTGAIDVAYNDWAKSHYSKRTDVHIPDIEISCVNAETAARHRSRPQAVIDAEAFLKTNITLAVIGRKYDFSQERQLQQDLIRRQDQRTARAPFLLLPWLPHDESDPDMFDPSAQSIPPLPFPEIVASSQASSKSSLDSEPLARRSSFKSTTSRTSSVVRSRSPGKSLHRLSHPPFLRADSGLSNRPSTHRRDHSASTGRHSAFYSAVGDHRDSMAHNSIAFSSQYFPPYFPLENLQPDAAFGGVHNNDGVGKDEAAERVSFDLNDVDPKSLSQEHSSSSLMVEFTGGISASCNPEALRHLVSLAAALQPPDPEDILDNIQISSMTEIIDLKKLMDTKGGISEVFVRIAKVNMRFLNAVSDYSDPAGGAMDQYDLSFTNINLFTREKTRWKDPFQPDTYETRNAFHVRIESCEASAAKRTSVTDGAQAAAMVQVENAMVWLGSKNVTYIDTDIGSVNVNMASSQVEYVAGLIDRTTGLVSELGDVFRVLSRHQDRRKYLTYRLLTDDASIVDPPFLVRPSAVLRSAKKQLRTFDSWKLVMRLRQAWSAASPSDKQQLGLECLADKLDMPTDVASRVVDAFGRWRNWDLDDVSQSNLIKHVFGPQPRDGQAAAQGSDLPLIVACKLKELQLLVDPGPKQNKIGVGDVHVRLERRERNDGQHHDDAENVEEEGTRLTANVYCGQLGAQLNWDMCELVQDILRFAGQTTQSSPDTTPPSPGIDAAAAAATSKMAIHVVVVVDGAAFEVETVNLNAKSVSNGVKASLSFHPSDGGNATDFITKFDAITSSLHSHVQLLGTMQVEAASVFVSHALELTETKSSHTIKATATSQALSCIVKQDPIVLLEVVDAVIKDEAAQLYHLNDMAPSTPKAQKPNKKMAERLSSIRVNFAAFLDRYTISIPLLRSLTYNITGGVARAAMAANFGRELIFDFDIDENLHEMQIQINKQPRSVSLLRIPPTNGRVESLIGPTEQSVSAFVSVELIQLDASAAYSLLRALNRPEVANTIQEINEQASVIQRHADEVFGLSQQRGASSRPQSQISSDPKVVYNVNLTMEGLKVFGNAPLKSTDDPQARISFWLDTVYVNACNRHDPDGPILSDPDIHAKLKEISLDIQRGGQNSMGSCGSVTFGAAISARTRTSESGKEERAFNFSSEMFDVQLSSETISTLIEVLAYLGDKIKDIDTSRELDYLRKLRHSKPIISVTDTDSPVESDILDSFLSSVVYQFEVRKVRFAWFVVNAEEGPSTGKEDLILSIELIEFGTRTKKSARLTIQNFKLQMVPAGQDPEARSHHSAVLPEVIFNVAHVSNANARRFAFQAVGKSLDLRLTSGFIIPAAHLQDSITDSIKNVRQASLDWGSSIVPAPSSSSSAGGNSAKSAEGPHTRSSDAGLFRKRLLESLLVDADFAGAVVYVSGKRTEEIARASRSGRPSLAGKYGQFNADDSGSAAVLRTPGLACKVKYRNDGHADPNLYGEIKIDASSNILYPSVMPLVVEIMAGVKEVVSDDSDKQVVEVASIVKSMSSEEDNILTADPSAVLGRLRVNLGLRICRQEFSLSCQPISRVAASACFDDIYFTFNTVHSLEQGNFFAISGAFSCLEASVQHVYSRDPTGKFEVDSIVLSLMNSKHVSGTSGVSAILKVSPMKVAVNAKQVQDFLLFGEIWYPSELRKDSVAAPVAKLSTEASQQSLLVHRYQQVAATTAFPWTASISITSLDVSVDLGQSIGKSDFAIKEFWMLSKKTTDWEQNLCLGFGEMGISSSGRLSGFVALKSLKLRTSIQWPEREQALNRTPLVQASLGFSRFRLKAAFDYQAFLVADITSFEFLMHNDRNHEDSKCDRLVAILDGDKVQVFGTTTSAAQAFALYQALQKFAQERRNNFESSVREIEQFTRRRSYSATPNHSQQSSSMARTGEDDGTVKSPISLDTDVVVTLRAVNLGVFPGTFADQVVFKMEALDAEARFAASIEDQSTIHSTLGLTLGQLRIGLAGVRTSVGSSATADHHKMMAVGGELSVDDIVERATGSRGGTILKVPKVEAIMQTWQEPRASRIEYIFKSAFEGKVEVGWNYSRISHIRGMWANHTKSLEQTSGRVLSPMASIKVTGVPEVAAADDKDKTSKPGWRQQQQQQGRGEQSAAGGGEKEQQKITAEVNVPQSKYEYVALEPPIIETPQLRDMGEATPPLEWIGLNRDRLPTLTHQIVIVSLLELAGEVEDAYSRILGSS